MTILLHKISSSTNTFFETMTMSTSNYFAYLFSCLQELSASSCLHILSSTGSNSTSLTLPLKSSGSGILPLLIKCYIIYHSFVINCHNEMLHYNLSSMLLTHVCVITHVCSDVYEWICMCLCICISEKAISWQRDFYLFAQFPNLATW